MWRKSSEGIAGTEMRSTLCLNGVGWVAQLVKLVELRVKKLEVQSSSPVKEKN
ncbi:hypothetical protein A2U01_0064439 [Trifolium medium]|uniref:Uncharacterized protein n=1 Tax=Trifolium medium TaxID=97028 RepID=A0A392S437_9FABA|nr:hypothetical protein [Trifolium medium]